VSAARIMLGAWLPGPWRRRLHTIVGAVRRASSDATASALGGLLQVFPDGVLIRLRERLSLRRPLDYSRAAISLVVTSEAERELRLRSCRKEPETVEWLETTLSRGDVLYDVGANVGAYSLIAAARMTEDSIVYAFEPGYRTFASLVENVFANGADRRVVPFQIALGDTTGVARFAYASQQAGAASHPGLAANDHRSTAACHQPVLVYRLDEFARAFELRSPTHLKIDVDGAELAVLRGAGAMLAGPSLRFLLVEVQEGESDLRAVRELLIGSGWVLDRDEAHTGGVVHNWIFTRR
jgi:FkbM family methyltransferase